MARKRKGIPGLSWSWKRATGLSAAKGRLSRQLGVPLSRQGRQRKIGKAAGCLVPLSLLLGGLAGASLALATLLLSPSTVLLDAADCAAIADRSVRLQCFTAVPEITATVGRVIDGDTLDICISKSCIRVRLCGIDAPERGEPGYREATEVLRSLVSRATVRCVPVGQGSICDGRSRPTNRGRLVAQCFLDTIDIGGAMVERGLACDWERFSGGTTVGPPGYGAATSRPAASSVAFATKSA